MDARALDGSSADDGSQPPPDSELDASARPARQDATVDAAADGSVDSNTDDDEDYEAL